MRRVIVARRYVVLALSCASAGVVAACAAAEVDLRSAGDEPAEGALPLGPTTAAAPIEIAESAVEPQPAPAPEPTTVVPPTEERSPCPRGAPAECASARMVPSKASKVSDGAMVVARDDYGNNPTGRPGVTLKRDIVFPPYLWVANHTNHTVSRVNTANGREEGRYWVGINPSRTAVDLDGNVWIGGRNDGRLTMIHWDPTKCPDRDEDGRGAQPGAAEHPGHRRRAGRSRLVRLHRRRGAVHRPHHPGARPPLPGRGHSGLQAGGDGTVPAGGGSTEGAHHSCRGRRLRPGGRQGGVPLCEPHGQEHHHPLQRVHQAVGRGLPGDGLQQLRRRHRRPRPGLARLHRRRRRSADVRPGEASDPSLRPPSRGTGRRRRTGEGRLQRFKLHEGDFARSTWTIIPTSPGSDLRGVGFDHEGFAWTHGVGSDRIWKIDPATSRHAQGFEEGLPVGGGTHYTYSDFTGSTGLSFTAPRGVWRFTIETPGQAAALRALRWTAFVPAGAQAEIRIRPLTETGEPGGAWTPAPTEVGAAVYDSYQPGSPASMLDLSEGELRAPRYEVEVRVSTTGRERPVVNSVELLWGLVEPT